MKLKLAFSLFFLLALSTTVHADSVLITDFTQISGATFLDFPPTIVLNPISVGGVLITPNHPMVAGAFVAFHPGGPADPGSGDGYISCNCVTVATSSIVLNFSSPVAAFGVTFQHIFLSPNFGFAIHVPAVLQVFDGPNGSGNLLGSITSVGWLGAFDGNPDFVAIWSDSLNIRSAVLTGTHPETRAFAVDGYAVSQTPVPEPATLLLLTMGLAGVGAAIRKR